MTKLTKSLLACGLGLVLVLSALVGAVSAQTSSTPISGGSSFNNAVTITPGRYNLTHHQKGLEFDYFKLNFNKGDVLTFTVQTSDTGVVYNKTTKEFVDNKNDWNIYSCMQALDKDGAKLGAISAWGVSEKDVSSVTAQTTGFLYLKVGCALEDISMPKYSTFSIATTAPAPVPVVQAPPPAPAPTPTPTPKPTVTTTPAPVTTSAPVVTLAVNTVNNDEIVDDQGNDLGMIDDGTLTDESDNLPSFPRRPWKLYGGILVLLIIIVVLIISLSKKKKNNFPPTPPSMPNQTPPPPANPQP